ncbi:H-2 class I histocompatibility antigen, Q9 alpha chain-like isoform X2 [Megalops cyprinoides]|uniref:H-2 class I histocompatibility antigen, Q9 alpha chain-like isoform X2 n=1 Tax=Megalops cyprinoides TaxID=118141 RepID=UPI0018652FDE|nr:H-2 class I histocompatibility antigen, Q9 alpha chain-like isoform X2 [Megalops cyprinoides]
MEASPFASLCIVWAFLQLVSMESHSLRYFYTLIVDGGGAPRFMSVGVLNGVQIDRYDSDVREPKNVPTQEWMAQNLGAGFWESETETRKEDQRDFTAMMRDFFNHSHGKIHTFQAMCGCGFADDGSSWAGISNAHDGRTFLTFDPSSQGWLAVASGRHQASAQRVKRQWDGRSSWNQDVGHYVKTACLERLRKFLQYGAEALKRRDAPRVTVLSKGDRVTCLATGFYPQGAEVTWVEEGGDQVPGHLVLGGEELPNEDGTFQIRLTLKPSVTEQTGQRFICHVEHSSLDTPIQKPWEKQKNSNDASGIVMATEGSVMIILFCFSHLFIL